ncbi:GNAT family N-acetyltransferase [Vibrio sp. RE86]|uniref:GNAT family N-acetyltransferase n=1 Tax=Vibrio sp. RE86 TaxID=2607605 RepID=UPI0020A4C548|nr:GNAT family N-acetyltransferase [Vibrio sp. RE86]
MSAMQIEQLDPMKLPLVSRLYKSFYPSGKAKKDELTFVGYQENQLAAVVRFRTIEQCRLLTGMLVVPDFRGNGLGHELMAYCLEYVLTEGDYCFAYQHLESFYSQHGFTTIEHQDLPNALKSLFERYTRTKTLVPMKYRIG